MKQIAIPLTIAALLVFACTAIQHQKALPAVADSSEHRNLQVLPQNITHDQLIQTMRTFALSLGVRCNHCHVHVGPGERDFDFASDAKAEKEIARTMIRMTRAINQEYMPRVNGVSPPNVTCATCHRGSTIPRSETPAPPAG